MISCGTRMLLTILYTKFLDNQLKDKVIWYIHMMGSWSWEYYRQVYFAAATRILCRACISSFIWNRMEFILLFSMRVLKESAIDCERQCFSLINHHIMTLQVYTPSIPVTRKLYSTFVNGLFNCIEMDRTSTLILCTCFFLKDYTL